MSDWLCCMSYSVAVMDEVIATAGGCCVCKLNWKLDYCDGDGMFDQYIVITVMMMLWCGRV